MAIKIGINGFGRIGRLMLRAGLQRTDFKFVAVNDVVDAKTLAHLLKYDSTFGVLENKVEAKDDKIIIDGCEIKVFVKKNPGEISWKDLGVDVVLESTGIYTKNKEALEAHLKAGAKKVIVSAPAEAAEGTFVMGVNHKKYDSHKHNIVSCGSCTTNCLAPVVKILNDKFGIKHGVMTTIHAYTMDQRLQDAPHKDLRRARAAAISMIPTSTGAAKAIGLVIPEVDKLLSGIAIRVPTLDVSVVDLVVDVKKGTSKDEVNNAFKDAARGELKGILEASEAELVSIDFKGNPHSSIVDLPYTAVVGANKDTIKVLAWYDNEWGFSVRMLDLAKYMMA
jgi:glyceraldehyde 3-phosphate dehydrogenase